MSTSVFFSLTFFKVTAMKYNLKQIKTKNRRYLYDSVTSNILDIENFTEEEINAAITAINNNEHLKTQAYKEMIEAINNGLIKKLDNSSCDFWFDEKSYFDDFQKKNHLLIGITEKCNMRCKYCIYGGHYKNERIHSEKEITYEIIVKAIDIFLANSSAEHVVFNFYGGEPFINFDLIKKSLDYINQKNVKYSVVITTNGTLINDDVIDWFIANENIHIYISLAGTEDTHDKLRVYKDGSSKTFSQIKRNVLKIKAKDKNSYSNRLNFVFNIFSEAQLFTIRNFWNTEEMFSGIKNNPEITFIDCLQDDGTVQQLGEQIINDINDFGNPLEEYIRLLQEGKYDDIFVSYYDNKFIFIHKRDTENDTFKLFGVCRPFIHKFFVNVDGDINICENFILKNYFGNVNTKFDIYRVKKLLNSYKEARKNFCQECWARKLCSLCYKDIFDTNGNVNNNRALKMCNNERRLVEQLLIEYCSVLEINPDLLDHLDEQILVE